MDTKLPLHPEPLAGAAIQRRALAAGLGVVLNRSEIVRLEAIRELQPWFHGDARVILKDGAVLTWSRRYRGKVEGVF